MRIMSLSALAFTAAISIFTIGATAQNTPPPAKPGMAGMAGMSMMQSCPMGVKGADMKLSDTSKGIRVDITTKTGDVADLRRRADAMADMHSASASDPTKQGMMTGKMIPFTTKHENISNGSRLTLTPKDAVQLVEFRAQVRKHAEQMTKGDCSMMQGMMQGMMGGMNSAESAPKADDTDHDAHHPATDGK